MRRVRPLNDGRARISPSYTLTHGRAILLRSCQAPVYSGVGGGQTHAYSVQPWEFMRYVKLCSNFRVLAADIYMPHHGCSLNWLHKLRSVVQHP